jgi:Flp pilus assembly protein TadD
VKLEYAASIPYFTRAYTLDTTFILPLIHLGIAYLNLGQNTLSDSVFSLLELRRTRLSPFAQLMLDENRAFLAGDMMRALAAARAEVKLVPSSKWFYNLAWVAVRVNHAKEAIEALKHVDPDQIWIFYWSLLPEAYHMLGEHEKELETAREGRHRFPASSVTYFAELYALAALDRKTELRELLDEQASLRDVGTPAGVRRSMAEELRAHGHEDQAMVLLDEAINWYEGQALKRLDSLRESYAKTLYFARRWDKAKLVYEELLETSSKYSAAGRRYEAILGTIAARQGDRKRALEVSDWLKDLRVPYLRGSNTYKMACIAAILGDKEQAVSLLKESFLQGQAFGIGIHQDFDLESLWNYPPFIELLKPKG